MQHLFLRVSYAEAENATYLVDELLCNRTSFNAQHLARDRRRIDATPDHLLLLCYRAGGFDGEIDRRAVTIGAGQVAVCDLARAIDVDAVASDTIGLVVPKHLLAGVDVGRLSPRLPPNRERLLLSYTEALYRQLPHLSVARAAATRTDTLALLYRLFDPSAAADLLDGQELRAAHCARADAIIRARLARPDLTPSRLADAVGVSRATLYRVFEPLGGVARYMQEVRLEAVYEALANPLEARSIARLASAYGFATPAHLSRSFRERYGRSPREVRQERARREALVRQASPERVQRWWTHLAERG